MSVQQYAKRTLLLYERLLADDVPTTEGHATAFLTTDNIEETTKPVTTASPTAFETTFLEESTVLATHSQTTILDETVHTTEILSVVEETTIHPTQVGILTTVKHTTVPTTELPTTAEEETIVPTTELLSTIEETPVHTTKEPATAENPALCSSVLPTTKDSPRSTPAVIQYPKCCCTCCLDTSHDRSCVSCAGTDIEAATLCAVEDHTNYHPQPDTDTEPLSVTSEPKPLEGSSLPDRVQTTEEFQQEEKLTEELASTHSQTKTRIGSSAEALILDCLYSGYQCYLKYDKSFKPFLLLIRHDYCIFLLIFSIFFSGSLPNFTTQYMVTATFSTLGGTSLSLFLGPRERVCVTVGIT